MNDFFYISASNVFMGFNVNPSVSEFTLLKFNLSFLSFCGLLQVIQTLVQFGSEAY